MALSSVHISWNGGGERVFLTGSWCEWGAGTEMTRQAGAFVQTVRVVEHSTVEFKFIVDGNWLIDSHLPTITDESGNVNNMVIAPAATHISHAAGHPHGKAVSPKSASTPSSPAHASPSAPVLPPAPVPAVARETAPPSPAAPTSAAVPAVTVSSTSSDSARPSDAGGQAEVALKGPADLVVRKPLEARLVPPAPENGCCCTIS